MAELNVCGGAGSSQGALAATFSPANRKFCRRALVLRYCRFLQISLVDKRAFLWQRFYLVSRTGKKTAWQPFIRLRNKDQRFNAIEMHQVGGLQIICRPDYRSLSEQYGGGSRP